MGGSVQAMMRAAGYSNEKEFFKAVEDGKVLTRDVLPKFSEELKKMSRAGGALDKTMESTPAQFMRFMNALTETKLAFYDDGMNEGLAFMFRTFADSLKELKPLASALGGIFRGAISFLAGAIKLIVTPIEILTQSVAGLWNVLGGDGEWSKKIWSVIGAGGTLFILTRQFKLVREVIFGVNTQLALMMRHLMRIVAPLLLIEDMWAGFNGKDSYTKDLMNTGDNFLKSPQQFKDSSWPTKMVASQMGMFEMWKAVFTGDRDALRVTVNDSEFAKAITITTDKNNQAKVATTQSEVAQ